MKLYAFLDPENIKKKPINAMFIAAFFIFPSEFSISMISFSSLFILPFVLKVLETEEEPKKERSGLLDIFKRHEKTTIFFIFIFFGMCLEYMLLFGLVHPKVGNVAFEQQLSLVFRSPAGYFGNEALFWEIVLNNMRLVFISAF